MLWDSTFLSLLVRFTTTDIRITFSWFHLVISGAYPSSRVAEVRTPIGQCRTSKVVGCRGFPRHRRVSWGILPTQEYRGKEVGIARMGSCPRGLPAVQDYKGYEHIGAREFYRRVIVEIFRWIRRSSGMQSSPGGRRYENLKSVLIKLTSKDKKVESQSIGKEKNDPNPIDITRSDNNVGP